MMTQVMPQPPGLSPDLLHAGVAPHLLVGCSEGHCYTPSLPALLPLPVAQLGCFQVFPVRALLFPSQYQGLSDEQVAPEHHCPHTD